LDDLKDELPPEEIPDFWVSGHADRVFAILMAGAIFTIVIGFLLGK
jgi:hypothetical protein